MTIRARAPLRVSFAGGGTDVSPYRDERGGAVLSSTIDRYAYATLEPAERITVRSLDYDVSVTYSLDEEFVYDGQLDLAKGVIEHFRREHGLAGGFDVFLHNDAPPGSGLGSSSAICVALIGALARHLRLDLDDYAIAEMAFRIEREEVGIRGGRQDQYASTFGGFNLIEFGPDRTVVNPFRLADETLFELEYATVFAYIGGHHLSSRIIEKQQDNYSSGNADAIAAMDRLKELAYEMKDALLLGRLADVGALLDEGWRAKKRMATDITNPRIDEVYDSAKAAGAMGGKITGAGGGGFMFFLCAPERRFAVQEALRTHGAELVNFTFVSDGMRSWSVR